MAIPHPASIFGRHEFVVRRLHSLVGLVPIGGYLCFHLATNAAILDGAQTYQRRADQIHLLGPTTIFILAWSLILLPILFHALVGLIILTRGRRNLFSYPFRENWRYTLQRATGVVALVFIAGHVFHMNGWFHFGWWTEHVAGPLGGAKFDPQDAAATARAALRGWSATVVLYALGIVASVYHLANGLWTMTITWGICTSPKAQRRANLPCALVGIGLAVIGLGALIAMYNVDLPPEDLRPAAQRKQTTATADSLAPPSSIGSDHRKGAL